MADNNVTFKSNAGAVKDAVTQALASGLEICGGKAETYAKQLAPVGTPESTGIPGYKGGTLRNSITHEQENENTELVGSAVKYSKFVELGTYKMKARPFLRPAVENHAAEYKAVIEQELAKVGKT